MRVSGNRAIKLGSGLPLLIFSIDEDDTNVCTRVDTCIPIFYYFLFKPNSLNCDKLPANAEA